MLSQCTLIFYVDCGNINWIEWLCDYIVNILATKKYTINELAGYYSLLAQTTLSYYYAIIHEINIVVCLHLFRVVNLIISTSNTVVEAVHE